MNFCNNEHKMITDMALVTRVRLVYVVSMVQFKHKEEKWQASRDECMYQERLQEKHDLLEAIRATE